MRDHTGCESCGRRGPDVVLSYCACCRRALCYRCYATDEGSRTARMKTRQRRYSTRWEGKNKWRRG